MGFAEASYHNLPMDLSELRLLPLPRFRKTLVSRFEMRLRASLPLRWRQWIAKGEQYLCPLCDNGVLGFRPYGIGKTDWCPVCQSMRRHRLLWLFLQSRSTLLKPQMRILHLAPEIGLSVRLRRIPGVFYLSCDPQASGVLLRSSAENLSLASASLDGIICNHVLEHVPDDLGAMREFFRVLRPNGWAVITVPLTGDPTEEEPNLADPKERERRFGQHDHVRHYGPDIKERLGMAGFKVEVITGKTLADTEELERFGVGMETLLYFCVRPA
jgi:hypothetical protein